MTRTARLTTAARMNDRLRTAMAEWQNLVLSLDTVDPVTTEVVRVRAAKYHDCRT